MPAFRSGAALELLSWHYVWFNATGTLPGPNKKNTFGGRFFDAPPGKWLQAREPLRARRPSRTDRITHAEYRSWHNFHMGVADTNSQTTFSHEA